MLRKCKLLYNLTDKFVFSLKLTYAFLSLVAAVAAVVLPVAGPREGHAAAVGAAELVGGAAVVRAS